MPDLRQSSPPESSLVHAAGHPLPPQGMVAVASSVHEQIRLFTVTHAPEGSGGQRLSLTPLRTLSIGAATKVRGLVFSGHGRLLALGGKRRGESVLFNSLTAEQVAMGQW